MTVRVGTLLCALLLVGGGCGTSEPDASDGGAGDGDGEDDHQIAPPEVRGAWMDLRETNQAIALRIRKRALEHAIDHGKERGVGADAEGEGNERRQSEALLTPHVSESQPDVLEQSEAVHGTERYKTCATQRPRRQPHLA